MDYGPWLLGAASFVFGQLFGIWVEGFKERRAERRALEAERRTRSATAAEELLDLIDQATQKFDGRYEHGSGPRQDEVRDVVRLIQRKSLALSDPKARELMQSVANAYFHTHAIEVMVGDAPSQIAWKVRSEAHKVLGALLRPGENPVGGSDVLESYREAIRDHYAEYE